MVANRGWRLVARAALRMLLTSVARASALVSIAHQLGVELDNSIAQQGFSSDFHPMLWRTNMRALGRNRTCCTQPVDCRAKIAGFPPREVRPDQPLRRAAEIS